MELVNTHVIQMESEKPNDFEWEETNKLKTYKSKRYPVQSNKQHQNRSSVSQNKGVKCCHCGGDFPHQHGPCPAKGKFCSYCKKRNHFVSVCSKKKRKDIYQSRQSRVKQVDLHTDTCTENKSEQSENSETGISFGITVEQRYSQTERECLSIVYGVEHFHLFLFGKSFTLVTDHRRLTAISVLRPNLRQSNSHLDWNVGAYV